MSRYIAILCKDEDSAFGLHFPDLPGCVTAGGTEEEALANAAIALRLWAEDVEKLPEPSTMSTLRARADVAEDLADGGVAVSIPLITSGRRLRLNVMLEPSIIKATDEAAKAAGVSRSQFIERSLEHSLVRDLGAVRIEKKRRTGKSMSKIPAK